MSMIDNALAERDAAYFAAEDAAEALTEASHELSSEWEEALKGEDAAKGVAFLDTRLTCDDMFEDYSWEEIFKTVMSGDTREMADQIREKMSDLAGDHLEHVAKQNSNDY